MEAQMMTLDVAVEILRAHDQNTRRLDPRELSAASSYVSTHYCVMHPELLTPVSGAKRAVNDAAPPKAPAVDRNVSHSRFWNRGKTADVGEAGYTSGVVREGEMGSQRSFGLGQMIELARWENIPTASAQVLATGSGGTRVVYWPNQKGVGYGGTPNRATPGTEEATEQNGRKVFDVEAGKRVTSAHRAEVEASNAKIRAIGKLHADFWSRS
jgi:hypothetical protein